MYLKYELIEETQEDCELCKAICCIKKAFPAHKNQIIPTIQLTTSCRTAPCVHMRPVRQEIAIENPSVILGQGVTPANLSQGAKE